MENPFARAYSSARKVNWALWGGVAGFVVMLVLVIVTLVTLGRTKHELDEVATKQGVAIRTAQAQVRNMSAALATARAAPSPAPMRAAAPPPPPAAKGAMRAAVLGSLPGLGDGAQSGAPYKSATLTHTHGIPFPTAAAKGSRALPSARNSIWADDLPKDVDAAYKGARARQSADQMGGGFALTGNKELFNRTPDELDAKDIDVAKDAFPAPDEDAPKNGHEAVAAMYSFDHFRAAMDRNSFNGYLAPIYEQQGWSKLGARDPCLWQEHMAALRDEFPKNMSVDELVNSQMVPVSEQFYDFMTQAAEERGVDNMHSGCDGMGARAAGDLYEALEREAREGKTTRRIASGEAAQILREAMQSIPSGNEAAAVRAMQEIAAARSQAAEDGMRLPEPDHSQLQALADWIAAPSATAAKTAAKALAKAMRLPLPPPSYAR